MQEDQTPEFDPTNTYFAAAPPERIAEELMGKVSKFYAYLVSSNLVDLWRRSYKAYYGQRNHTSAGGWNDFDVGSLQTRGNEGELAFVKVNNYRNLLTHLLVLTTSSRPALSCMALNSDSQSLAQAYLGEGLLTYFLREKKIERNLVAAVETALVLGDGWVGLDWNAKAGKQYGVNKATGSPIFDGDIEAANYTPFDVVKDLSATSSTNPDWLIVRSYQNKYDLASKYPAYRDEILNTGPDDVGKKYQDPSRIIGQTGATANDTDLISVYRFYHRRSEALPQGRFTIFIDGNNPLYDGALPFEEVPVYRVSASDIINTAFSYTVGYDLLGLQELLDKLYSTVASNQMASGVQNFWSPPGNEVTTQQLAGALNLIESVVKPEALALLSTSPEIFNFINIVNSIMETLSGVSAVNRGDVSEKDMSGTALAFLSSQAITFSSGLQNSYNQLLESVGTGLISILKDYAATPRLALISGSFNRPLMKSFVGNDLSQIGRVYVEATSAASKTEAGKLSIADNLLQHGMLKSADEYISVLTTGSLESLYQNEMSEILLVHAENEDLRDGKQVRALSIDSHKLHILEHRAILANPDSRKDPTLVTNTLAHIQDHIKQYLALQQNNPALLALIGEPPLPVAQPQQSPPQNPSPNPGPQTPGLMNAQPAAQQQAQGIKAPAMPKLPAGTDPATQNAYQQQTANLKR